MWFVAYTIIKPADSREELEMNSLEKDIFEEVLLQIMIDFRLEELKYRVALIEIWWCPNSVILRG